MDQSRRWHDRVQYRRPLRMTRMAMKLDHAGALDSIYINR
nr:hypothetical protein JVH1_6826 [Rhodococcus sp. JVH1]